MQGFHSFWSLPNVCRNGGEIGFPDFEMLTAILSALKWQEKNGTIKLITDTPGAQFFEKVGLKDLWNEMDVSLDQMDFGIDPFLFWAAGKLYALKQMDTPCVMLDTDLIVWDTICNLEQYDIVAAHSEELYPDVYPDYKVFKLKDGYEFPKEWDFSLHAANTALLYMKNAEFRDYYVDAAIDFFKNVNIDGLNPITAMCFAEQRVLPMCAKVKEQKMEYLLDLIYANKQDLVTHTWGFKDVLRSSQEANYEFCMRCVRRIMIDFPGKEHLLADNIQLRKYWEDYKKVV